MESEAMDDVACCGQAASLAGTFWESPKGKSARKASVGAAPSLRSHETPALVPRRFGVPAAPCLRRRRWRGGLPAQRETAAPGAVLRLPWRAQAESRPAAGYGRGGAEGRRKRAGG